MRGTFPDRGLFKRKYRRGLLFCLFFILFFGGLLEGREEGLPKRSQEPALFAKEKWLPSPLFGFFKLQFNLPLGMARALYPGSRKDDGILSGLYGAAESLSKIGYFGMELDLEYGPMNPNKGSNFDLVKVDWDGKGGYPFGFNLGSKKAMVILFGGFSPIFSHWEEENNREQTLYALGGLSGIKFEIALSDRWRLATDLTLRSIWWGQMKSKTPGTSVTNDLKTSGGIRCRGFIEFFITKKMSLSFILKYEYRPLKVENYGTLEYHFLSAFLGARFHF